MDLPSTDRRLSPAGIVLANLVVLVGVAGFGWTLQSILVAYWIEAGVVGVLTVPGIYLAEGEDDPDEIAFATRRRVEQVIGRPTWWLLVEFVLFYGAVWLVVAAATFVEFSWIAALDPASPVPVAVAGVGLATVRVVTFLVEYVHQGGYRRTGPVTRTSQSLRWVVVLVGTILAGRYVVGKLGASVGGTLALAVVKTGVDLHELRHEWAQSRSEGDRAVSPE